MADSLLDTFLATILFYSVHNGPTPLSPNTARNKATPFLNSVNHAGTIILVTIFICTLAMQDLI